MKRSARVLAVVAAGALAASLAACSPASGSGEPSGEPAGGSGSEVTLAFLGDITGGAAFCGASALDGFKAGIEYVNENGLAGDATLVGAEYDTATNPQQAATEMSKIVASDASGVVIGCASAVSQASAPVAQSGGLPVVAMQSGTPAVIDAGEFIFRTTAPQSTYHYRQVDHYLAEGIETAAIVYQSNNPTLVELAEDVYPPLLEEGGVDVVATESFEGDGFDFAALVAKVVAADPDIVFLFGQGTPNVTVATQLIQQGYDGFVGGTQGFDGVLEPLGESANGFTWPTDFNAEGSAESTQEFVEFYTDRGGETPGSFQAQAFDAVLLFALGLAEASDTTDREAIREGIVAATEAGFDGAVGRVEFEDRDARVEGLLLEWRDGATRIVN
ncbi:ABC transporter substrate-binding protein [Agromyces aerolatus]|uniref:ABC transporter substrate-binding protein n=1 Tax=Agromyces sp. LY-1074 TaxID=3074080 RepID=UPI00285CFDC0|nr:MULTISPECIES: ABC transporter substrate-binding protein [unclassified Agromyces]MDR5699761.1 ABC transporter substrate-binding protein [Agromyces sp. LY-1074]MDR5706057.1 ABC transporter substrate-binding protein [Agromyces sp. LY-1358]